MMPRISGLLLLSLLAAGLIGCGRQGSALPGSKQDNASKPKPDPAAPAEVVIPVAQQADGVIASEPAKLSDAPEIIRAPGRIALPDNATWRVGAVAAGRIENVLVNLGDYVQKGQVLARMHSRDVQEAKASYLTALAERSRLEAAAALAQKNLERTERLYLLKAASLEQTDLARQQLLDAQTALHNSDLAVDRERAHLEDNLGISAHALESAKSGASDLISIRAPASGYILQKNITPGAVVETSTDTFVLGELRRLWMITSVREEYLNKLRLGQPATVTVNGLPDVRVSGRITDLGQQLDPTTHAMRVRIELDNTAKRLRPEMLGQAEIPIGAGVPMLFVPSDAIQQMEEQNVVFVRTSADHFAVRPVRTGEPVGDNVPVLEGLKAGELVVTHGSFVLKSEMLKSAMQSE